MPLFSDEKHAPSDPFFLLFYYQCWSGLHLQITKRHQEKKRKKPDYYPNIWHFRNDKITKRLFFSVVY